MKNEKTCKKKKFTIAKNSDMSDQATISDFLKCETCGATPCLTLTHSDYVTCRENFPCMTNKQIRFKIYINTFPRSSDSVKELLFLNASTQI